MKSIKPIYNRMPDGNFGPGNNANPKGRPKGKTLKEFAREMLMSMPDEEKLEYLKKLPPEIVWRMSEGNPHNTQDVTSEGKALKSAISIEASPQVLALKDKYEQELLTHLKQEGL